MAFPLTGLVSYWTLDEASGTRQDSHGTNHLTPTNAPVGAAGKIGNGCRFTASSAQSLSLAVPPLLGDEDWTYTFWFKRNSFGSVMTLLSDNDFGPARRYEIGLNDVGHCLFSLFTPYTQARVYAPTFNDTNWRFVTAWHDAAANTGNLEVDLNGTGEDPAYGTYAPPSGAVVPLVFGKTPGSAEYFDGILDEVGLWRRVLTAQERTDLYNGGAGLAYPAAPVGLGAGDKTTAFVQWQAANQAWNNEQVDMALTGSTAADVTTAVSRFVWPVG